jgi:hypothetical protein
MEYVNDKLQVVIARYNENLDWTDKFKSIALIYNKGNDFIPYECIYLENTGREGDTYLKHIILNYPNFPEYTLFTQAKIEDHVRSPTSFKQNIHDIAFGNKTDLNGYIGLSDVSVNSGWNEITDFNDSAHGGLPLKEWWNKYFVNQPENNVIKCNYSGIFMTSKDNILFHPREFYENLDEYLLATEPTGGYCLERLWTTIFDGKTVSKFDRQLSAHETLINKISLLKQSLQSLLHKYDN